MMDTVWDKIKQGLKDGASLSIEKIEEYTKIGKLRIEKFSTEKKIERNINDMGWRLLELIEESKTDGVSKDILITNAVENIKVLQEELADLEQRIEQAADERSDRKNKYQDDDDITGI